MKTRHKLLAIWVAVFFMGIPAKLLYIHFFSGEFFHLKSPITDYRFPIYDRNGNILAATIQTVSIYIDPSKLSGESLDIIKRHFPCQFQQIKRYRDRNLKFLWLERHVDQRRLDEVKELYIPMVHARRDYKRVYPFGSILSSVIGFCDGNGNGQHGVEYAMNKELFKKPVKLSIDIAIQSILRDVMCDAVKDFDANGGSGMVLDARSGKIRAMVSIPEPQSRSDFIDHSKRNRNLDPVEVGSIMKLANIAIAIESGKYSEHTMVDATGPLKIGPFEINDFFGVNREVTLGESLWRSSNIANARVALDLGPELQRISFEKLGLLKRIEWMPSCFARVIAPRDWNKTTTATLGYGYGLAITTLHLARMVLAIANGRDIGISIFAEDHMRPGPAIFNQDTVKVMQRLMHDVVNKGYRKVMNVPGYKVGAKTGTANLVIDGKYTEGRNLVTIAATLPSDQPRLLIIIQMTDPKRSRLKHGKFTTAANVLGSYMKTIIERISIVENLSKHQTY